MPFFFFIVFFNVLRRAIGSSLEEFYRKSKATAFSFLRIFKKSCHEKKFASIQFNLKGFSMIFTCILKIANNIIIKQHAEMEKIDAADFKSLCIIL